MKILNAFAFLLLVSTTSARPRNQLRIQAVPFVCNDQTNAIKDQYVVILKGDKDVDRHLMEFRQSLPLEENLLLLGKFSIGSFKGYGSEMTSTVFRKLRQRTDVRYIECNRYGLSGQLACTSQLNAPWGIVRTTKANLPSGTTYDYDVTTAGLGIDVYIIDSGIDITHGDFEGRASWGKDFVNNVDDPNYKKDIFGHGTHVAGTVMSKTYGVAKKANAIAVNIFDDEGRMTTLHVILAVDYVVTDDSNKRTKNNRKRAVINMSVGMPKSDSIREAVNSAVVKGLVVVVAAGNEKKDACEYSPANVPSAITVMASDKADKHADFSNYGKCGDIYAPGVDIMSTWPKGSYKSIPGTSMASPHVAGAVAKYLSKFAPNKQPSPAAVEKWLKNGAQDKIRVVPPKTTKKLLYYKDC